MNILLAPYVTLRFLLTRSNSVIACCAVLGGNNKEKMSARVIVGLTSQESWQAMLAGVGDGAAQGQEAPAGCGRTVPPHSTACSAQLTRVWSLELGEVFSFSVSVWGWLTHRRSARRECLFRNALQYYLETLEGWIFLPGTWILIYLTKASSAWRCYEYILYISCSWMWDFWIWEI